MNSMIVRRAAWSSYSPESRGSSWRCQAQNATNSPTALTATMASGIGRSRPLAVRRSRYSARSA